MKEQPIITLLTDFGSVDGFVGVMKGVMLQICPNAHLIDISHDIPPFSISSASFLMEWSYEYYPPGTIHLCVVDPGVGTNRRILIVQANDHYFVAPDNGVLTPIIDTGKHLKIFSITNERYWRENVSNTFHGRDIFSPISAYLAKGIPPSVMGKEINDPVRLPMHPIEFDRDIIHCHVRYIDRFGNLVTDLDIDTYKKWSANNGCTQDQTIIQFQDTRVMGISQSYGMKKRGELLAVFDGYDRLEIAQNGGDASRHTGLGIDAPVKVCTPW